MLDIPRKKIIIIWLLLGLLLVIIFETHSSINTKSIVQRSSNDEILLYKPSEYNVVYNQNNILKYLSTLDEYEFYNVYEELIFNSAFESNSGKLYKFDQYYHNHLVFGRGLNVFVRDRTILSITGNYLSNIDIKDIETNEDLVVYSLGSTIPEYCFIDDNMIISYTTKQILYRIDNKYNYVDITGFDDPEVSPYVYGEKRYYSSVSVTRSYIDYFDKSVELTIEKTMDAPNGKTEYVLADSLRNIYISDFNYNKYVSLPSIYYINETGEFDDKYSITAYDFVRKSYDYFASGFYNNSTFVGIDGKNDNIRDNEIPNNEKSIQVIIHYARDNEVQGFNVDLFNRAYLVFSDYTSVLLDVVGHEYSHSVIKTISNLIYLNGSGAINEAMSDIFGSLIQDYNLNDERFWKIGEGENNNLLGLRNMSSPSSFGLPSNYSYKKEFCYKSHAHGSDCDSGGVHSNSSLLTFAQYKMYQKYPSLFTKEVIGNLWFHTLGLLPSDADFHDFRLLMIESAKQLNYSNEIIQAISTSFDEVGIYGTEGQHQIIFDLNGYEGVLPNTIVKNFNDSFVIKKTNIVKNGYTQIGWSVTGNGNSKIYYIGHSDHMPGFDLVLKPVFVMSMWNNLDPVKVFLGAGSSTNPYLIGS
jgi:thermolysin